MTNSGDSHLPRPRRTRKKTRKLTKLSPADRRARLMLSDAWSEWPCYCPTCHDIPRSEPQAPPQSADVVTQMEIIK